MLYLQHAPVRPSLHVLAVPALRTCHRPLCPCRPSLATQAIRPVTRVRPPAPPPARSARHPHSHRLFSCVCRMHVCSTRPSARPSTFSPCQLSAPATVLCARAAPPWPPRPYARLCDCVHPPLRLLAVLATRTRTISLAVSAGCMSAARARPPVPPPSRRARPQHLPPSFAPVPPVLGHSGHTPGYAIASARPSTFLQCSSPALAPSS